MSDNSSSNDDLPVNLDPAVAALLQKDPQLDTTMTASSIRITMAQMKLQQARVRGNSDYAAKVMDEAIAEGARDREVWTLLDTRIKELEDHIATNQQQQQTESEETKKEKAPGDDGTDNLEQSSQDNTKQDIDTAKVEQLEQQVKEASDRADTVESILSQYLRDEIENVKAEQASLQEREDQLRARIRSLQVALQSLPESESSSSNNNISAKQDLQDAMKDIHELQSTLLKTQCTICHENTATRAVIPCGHLCLCDECVTRMTKTGEDSSSSSPQQRQCPLCRGHLLSTIHIYTTK